MISLSETIENASIGLHEYITESENQMYIPKSASEFWGWVANNKKADTIKKLLTQNDVDKLYGLATKQPSGFQMPFVVNYGGSNSFACRRWVVNSGVNFEGQFKPSEKIRGIYSGLHNTMFKDDMTSASRAERGLLQEKIDLANIIEFSLMVSELMGKEKVDRPDIKRVIEGRKDLERFVEMYEKGALDTLIAHATEMIANTNIDEQDRNDPARWTDCIELTGASNTHRNDNGELYDENFVLDTKNTHEVLKNSGRIISDITIYKKPGKKPSPQKSKDPNAKVTNDDIYISCKMKDSQLSGVSARGAMQSNAAFIEGMTPVNNKYPTFKEQEAGLKSFINFWNNFGVDPEEIYNFYQQLQQDNTVKFKLNRQKNYDPKALGQFIRKLVGGNYWYLKPTECRWVPDISTDFTFNIENVLISAKTGKTINIVGKINNKVDCTLVLRTDNADVRFPYRIFPSVIVSELLDLCSVPDENAAPKNI